MPQKQSISAFLKDRLTAHEAGYQRQLVLVEEAQAFLAMRARLAFRVKVTSLWVDHGEKPVCLEKKGSLRAILKEATEEFKKLNNRGDVQAKYEVSVLFPNSYTVELLPEVWEQFR